MDDFNFSSIKKIITKFDASNYDSIVSGSRLLCLSGNTLLVRRNRLETLRI